MLDKVSTCGNLLHIVSHWEDLVWGGGYSVIENTQTSQDLAKFQFSGGGGVFCNWKYSESQDLAKFQFSGGGGIL